MIRALLAVARSAFAEAWTNRTSFWSSVGIMFTNDIVWVLFWLVFFDRVDQVRGWDSDLTMLLLAVLTTSGGIVLGLFANARRIAELTGNGGLDAALALPVPTLPYLLLRRVEAVNLGDFFFGVGLFLVVADLTPANVITYVAGVLASVAVLTGFFVAVGSLAFFVRGQAGDLGFQAMLLLAAYPVDVFAGPGKLVLYTVVPAAFVSAVPARLIADFDAADAALLVSAALACAAGGWLMFRAGLHRYSSGAVWTRA